MMTPHLYTDYIGAFDSKSMSGFAYIILYSFLIMLLLPYLFSRIVLNANTRDTGWLIPAFNFKNVGLTILALLLMLPFSYLFSKQPQLKIYYSLNNLSIAAFLFVTIFLQPLYYLIEEYFFRGFMFLTIWRYVGWHSFWITDIVFVYAHISKPVPELLLSIPGSVILNYLTLKTKSFLPAVLVHTLLGGLLNILIYFQLT
jgi:membrane protease YdiL (CAAX protease family)